MKQVIKRVWAIIVVVMVLMMAALPVMAEEKPLVEIDIYSVNDFHGAIRAEGEKTRRSCFGGRYPAAGSGKSCRFDYSRRR